MKLRIEKAIYGGAGLARVPAEAGPPLAGKTVFTGATLPGELVEARILEDKRIFATGQLETILEASPERVVPGCEYVPRCGGCQYQHANPTFQLQMKLDILKETLARARVAVAAELEAVAGPPWGYRNRIRLQVSAENGLAYREGGSHTLLPVTHCPIAAPLLEQAIAAVSGYSGLKKLCDEVEFFTNGEQNQLLVSLWPRSGQRSPDKLIEGFAEKLQAQLPMLTGVGLSSEGGMSYWGQRSLVYTVAGHAYQASLGGFFQVNRFLLPDLLRLVVHDRSGQPRSGHVAWDLYSGAGLFARALAFENVTAVESAGVSADDLKQNLAGRAHRIVRSSTLEFLRGKTGAGKQAKPDLILVDPPRAGLGKEICGLLGKVAAAEIVYVSCDPATLARDLQSLLPSGYSAQSIHLVDLFPQTFHMETVTTLKRN
jgi:23S rRNA (uracil1939-C5)-methyltransferase